MEDENRNLKDAESLDLDWKAYYCIHCDKKICTCPEYIEPEFEYIKPEFEYIEPEFDIVIPGDIF